MEFFKVINLEQSEEQVLLVKNQDKDNNNFSVELFINVKGETHTAKFSFENESDRDNAFNEYNEAQASAFLEFMHNSVIK
jgi:hypothetical protein